MSLSRGAFSVARQIARKAAGGSDRYIAAKALGASHKPFDLLKASYYSTENSNNNGNPKDGGGSDKASTPKEVGSQKILTGLNSESVLSPYSAKNEQPSATPVQDAIRDFENAGGHDPIGIEEDSVIKSLQSRELAFSRMINKQPQRNMEIQNKAGELSRDVRRPSEQSDKLKGQLWESESTIAKFAYVTKTGREVMAFYPKEPSFLSKEAEEEMMHHAVGEEGSMMLCSAYEFGNSNCHAFTLLGEEAMNKHVQIDGIDMPQIMEDQNYRRVASEKTSKLYYKGMTTEEAEQFKLADIIIHRYGRGNMSEEEYLPYYKKGFDILHSSRVLGTKDGYVYMCSKPGPYIGVCLHRLDKISLQYGRVYETWRTENQNDHFLRSITSALHQGGKNPTDLVNWVIRLLNRTER